MTTPKLTDATVDRRSNDVALTWTIKGDLPNAGSWLLSTTLIGGENGPIHQFGVKAHDGRITDTFIFDFVATQQYNYRVNPEGRGTRTTIVFPVSDLDVAASGKWRATLTVDGADLETVEGAI